MSWADFTDRAARPLLSSFYHGIDQASPPTKSSKTSIRVGRLFFGFFSIRESVVVIIKGQTCVYVKKLTNETEEPDNIITFIFSRSTYVI